MKLQKNQLKHCNLDFQGRSRSLILLERLLALFVQTYAVSLCLSATFLMLDQLTVAKVTHFEGIHNFDAPLLQRTS